MPIQHADIGKREGMSSQRFVIPFKLPSLNDVICENRKNPYSGANLKKTVERDIQMVMGKLRPVENPCIVRMEFVEQNKKRDVDNVESSKKFVLDALVKKGILTGDGPRHVAGTPSIVTYDKENGPRVVVTIIENEKEEVLRTLLYAAFDWIPAYEGVQSDG